MSKEFKYTIKDLFGDSLWIGTADVYRDGRPICKDALYIKKGAKTEDFAYDIEGANQLIERLQEMVKIMKRREEEDG